MRKNNSGFIQIILVIILIVLVGGGMYYFGKLSNKQNVVETPTEELVAMENQKPGLPTVKPTADPTAGWKIFLHKSGYSIKYPSEIKVVAMKNFDADPTPIDEYADIKLSSVDGFSKPHMRIIRLVNDFSDTKLPLMEVAQKYYQANLDMPSVPAVSVQAPKQGTFLEIPSVSYAVRNKGFKTIVDEYLGYEGVYRVVWLEKDNHKYMIYWTEDKLFDQILSTFKFTK
jgi:hypothetical protein